jgi:hypothetical protein
MKFINNSKLLKSLRIKYLVNRGIINGIYLMIARMLTKKNA